MLSLQCSDAKKNTPPNPFCQPCCQNFRLLWCQSNFSIFQRSSVRSGEMAKSTQLIDNEVFRAYATYAAIVLVKMMLMSLVTAYFRITRKVRKWEYCLLGDCVQQLHLTYSTLLNHLYSFLNKTSQNCVFHWLVYNDGVQDIQFVKQIKCDMKPRYE